MAQSYITLPFMSRALFPSIFPPSFLLLWGKIKRDPHLSGSLCVWALGLLPLLGFFLLHLQGNGAFLHIPLTQIHAIAFLLGIERIEPLMGIFSFGYLAIRGRDMTPPSVSLRDLSRVALGMDLDSFRDFFSLGQFLLL